MAEIYSYGEETVVVPVSETATQMTGAKKLAADAIEKAMQKFTDQMKVEMPSEHKAIVYVPKQYIAGIIGKEGKNIMQMEEKLGIGLDIRELGAEDAAEASKPAGDEVHHELNIVSKYIEIHLGEKMKGQDIDIYVAKEYLATFNIGKKGIIRIKKSNPLGKAIMNAQKYGERIRIFKT